MHYFKLAKLKSYYHASEIVLSAKSGIHCASVAFPSGSDRKTEGVLWIQSDGMMTVTASFIQAIGNVYREAEPHERSNYCTSFEKSGEFRELCIILLSRSVSPVHVVAYRTWEIEWRAQITFLHISRTIQCESIDERRERKRVRDSHMLLRDMRDNAKETMAHAPCLYCACSRQTRVRENRAGVILRNVLVSDIVRTINNCISDLSILP